MKTVSKFSLGVTLACLAAAGITSLSQVTPPTPPSAANHRLDKLAGGWSVKATPEGQDSFPGLMSFNADGNVLGSQVPVSAFETPGYGNWIATSPNQAAYTFITLFANEPVVSTKVVGTLRYDPRSDTWNGSFRLHVFLPDGSEITELGSQGSISATRIAVEMLD